MKIKIISIVIINIIDIINKKNKIIHGIIIPTFPITMYFIFPCVGIRFTKNNSILEYQHKIVVPYRF